MPPPHTPRPPVFAHDPLRPQGPLVAHRWLLIGTGVVVLGSVMALYAALALLFWQGQWQLIFHPANAQASLAAPTPASLQMPFVDVRFDASESGQPQLHGWWIPARDAGPHSPVTVLYLHPAHGALADTLPDLLALHALGVNVFAFETRGFGQSAWARPSERRWDEDADAALAYLTGLQKIPLMDIVPVGRGLGGTVAATLAARHPELRGLVMIDPQPPTIAMVSAPAWTRILPVRLLARDRFDPAQALAESRAVKLFLTTTPPAYLAGATQPWTMVPSTLVGDQSTAPALHRLFASVAAQR